MSVSLTLELPDSLSQEYFSLLPEDERQSFGVAAIAYALKYRQETVSDLVTIVDQSIDDLEAGVGLLSFGDFCKLRDAEIASYKLHKSH